MLVLLDVHLRTDLLFNVTRCIQQLLGATDAANRIKGDSLFYQMIPAPRQAPPLLPLSVHLQVAHRPLHLRACKDVGQKGYHWLAANTAAAMHEGFLLSPHVSSLGYRAIHERS